MAKEVNHKGKALRARTLSNSRAETVYDTIEVKPVTPIMGVNVSGVDMTTAIPEAQVVDLKNALANHNVLFFRDQPELTAEQQITFGRNFGDLHIHPAAPSHADHPEIFVVHTHEKSQVNNGSAWHSDVSCDPTPPSATMLQMHVLPSAGGDTLFANMYAAFDALSDRMKDFLRGLTAQHESESNYRGRYSDRGVDDTGKVFPEAEHPIVRIHPVSGRECLFVNRGFTSRIRGLAKEESAALLGFLLTHAEQPQYQVRFEWEKNAIAFWDNRCTQHYAMWDYWPEERKGHRVTIGGERPFGGPITAAAE